MECPTYRRLCVDSGIKPNSALLKIVGGDNRELALVQELDLSRAYIGPKHVVLVAELIARGSLPSLESLDLSGNDVPHAAVQHIFDALTRTPAPATPALRKLSLRGCFLPLAEAKLVLDFTRAAGHLMYVDLSGSDTDTELVRAIELETELHRRRVCDAAEGLHQLGVASSGPTNALPEGARASTSAGARGGGAAAVPGSPTRSRTVTMAPIDTIALNESGSPYQKVAAGGNASSTVGASVRSTANRLVAEQVANPLVDDFEWLTNCADEDDMEARLNELIEQGVLGESGDAATASAEPEGDSSSVRDERSSSTRLPVIGVGPVRQMIAPTLPSSANFVLDAVPAFPKVSEVLDRVIKASPGVRGYTTEGEDSDARTAEKFIDSSFPPCERSLCRDAASAPTTDDPVQLARLAAQPSKFRHCGRRVRWARLTDHPRCEEPRMYFTEPSTVVKGSAAANQWLVSAMRVVRGLSSAPAALSAICIKSYVDLGVFVIGIWKGGSRVDVVVDDFVPVDADSGELLCTHNSNPNELWAALVEKAMAKLHGGYDRLSRGTVRTGLADMIGGRTLKRHWKLADVSSMVASGALAKIVNDAVTATSMDTVVLGQPKARGELERTALRSSGLAPNDAYIVDATRQLDDRTTVVRLRQPVPELRWQGRFGPDSRDLQDDTTQRALGWHADQAPKFLWMTIEDYAAFFGNLYVHEWHSCGQDASRAVIAEHGFTWSRSEHAGPYDMDPLWTSNPTVGLRVQRKNTVVSVQVSLPDQRLRTSDPLEYAAAMQVVVLGRELPPQPSEKGSGGGASPNASSPSMGMSLLDSSLDQLASAVGDVKGTPHGATPHPAKLRRDWNPATEMIFKSPVTRGRDVSVDVVMQPNVDYYVVVGVAGVNATKVLTKLRSTGRMSSTTVESIQGMCTARSEWASHSAGGAAFASTLTTRVPPQLVEASGRGATNPQFLLRTKRRTALTIILAQDDMMVTNNVDANNTPAHPPASPNRAVMLSGRGTAATPSLTSSLGTSAAHRQLASIGFVVAEGFVAFTHTGAISEKAVCRTDFAQQRSVSLEVTLDTGAYIVVPCTHIAGEERPFALHVFSSEGVELKKISI